MRFAPLSRRHFGGRPSLPPARGPVLHSRKPGVLGSRTLRRTEQVRLRSSPAVPRDGSPVARPSPRSRYGVSCIMRARPSGEVKQGNLRRGVQSHRGEGGADPAADVQARRVDPVKPFRIRGSDVGEAETPSRQAQLYLAAVVVTRQGEGNSAPSGLGKDLRTM